MAESIIIIAEEIIDNLVPQVQEKIGKLWGVEQEIEVLRDTVSKLLAVLNDAEKQYFRNPEVQVWLDKLKDAFYDAQDVLEDFNMEAMRRVRRGPNEMMEDVRTFFSSSNQLAFKLKMRYKVRAVKERILAIKDDRAVKEKILAIKDDRKFHLNVRNVDLPVERERRKGEETRTRLLGRDGDETTIQNFLLDSDVKESVSILPIVGSGGIGKTFLAENVYNDEKLSKHFNLRMWVRVSNDFDLKKIMKNIIACAKKIEATEVTMERLQTELEEEINGKRYFLVLDDVRTVKLETWQSLKTILLGGARGSKILVTTRDYSVVKITSTTGPLHLKELSESASLELFKQMACDEEIQDPDMLAIAEKIVRRCSGIPLAIQTVARSFYLKKTKAEWLHVQHDLFPEEHQIEDNIMSVLRVSYDGLPSELKQCFAYCSLFPKGYEIKKQTLINLWVAEGFIQPSNRSQHLEDIAHEYFMDLVRRSLIGDSGKDLDKNKETCRMHDLIHDLACSVAGFDCRRAWDDTNPIPKRTRCISCGSNSNLMGDLPIALRSKASSLRTIISVPTYHEMEQRKLTSEVDLCQLIQSFKRLRILDLHATIVKKVPRSICKLKHLTYLDFSHNNALKRLPNSITRLQNLLTLNLQGCSALEDLPKGIGKLVCLRNLDIDYCSNLDYVPSGLGQLTSLHRLTRFILPKGKAVAKNYCGLGELNGLNNIHGSLRIENLGHLRHALAESMTANLIEKHSLESLVLKWGYLDTNDAEIGNKDRVLLDGLTPPSNLQNLTIDEYDGESFPRWMMNSLVLSLPNLVEIRLLRCRRCKQIPQLGQLPRLKSLEIWMLPELEDIQSDDSTASFRSLLRLEIRHCENLKTMPRSPHLEKLILREVNRELIEKISGLNKLTTLYISQMESLKCLPEQCLQSLTSLESLGISECPQLTFLPLGMQHLSNLVHLSFTNCEELDLSKDQSNNIWDLQGLESLRSVDIVDIPKLVSLPCWLLQISNLERLSIKKCLNLKELPEKIEDLQSLGWLEIIRCPLLTFLPEGMQKLKSLSHLRIAGCPDLEKRCKKDVGKDKDKISHIQDITNELKYYERNL